MTPRERQYWRFFWPLSLLGVVVLSGRLVQNYVLLGYPEGVEELALYALASAVFGPFRAGLIFVPQMANVLVRGPRSLRACARFAAALCLALSAPVALLGWTRLGPAVLARLYEASPRDVAVMARYLRYLLWLIPLTGASGFAVGLLVQARRTGLVTALRVLHVGLLVGVLAGGIRLGWDPVVTIGLSLIVPQAVHLALAVLLLIAVEKPGWSGADEPLRQREVAAYYVPLVGTALLFALSRPIIYGFITALNPTGDPALPDVKAMVAAVTLASTFVMIFQATINQFRNLFATFGREDLPGVRRFMAGVTAGVTVLLVAAVVSPAARLFFRHLQGADGETLRMATQAMWPLCLVPVVVALRNYCHGLAMVHHRTGAMFVGALARNGSILLCAAPLFAAGLYNHVAAAAMLVAGFGGEALVGLLLTGGLRNELNAEP